MHDKHFRLGTQGWDRPAWEHGFYPEALPPEWRLTYYNTQFGCVYLGAADWRDAGPAGWQSWADDTHAGFRFLLEAQADAVVPAALAPRAWLVTAADPRLIWFDAASDLKALSRQLIALPAGEWCLLSGDGDAGQIERVRTVLQLLGHPA